ncbi:MAG: ABC transporter permease [Metamycoplasmataceae bacterium]
MKNLNAEKSILALINKFFWKSKVGPLTMFLLPTGFMLIYFVVGNSRDGNSFFVQAFPSFIALSVLPVTLISLPQMLVEIKQSVILRRISTSSITPIKYNLIVSAWFFLMCCFSTLFVIILFLCFLNKDVSEELAHINWGEFLIAILMLYITSIATGIVLSSVSKKSSTVQLIGLSFMLLTITLAGYFIPISVIGGIDAIKYISLFSPINYSTSLLNNVLLEPVNGVSKSIFDFSDFFITDFTDQKEDGSFGSLLIITSWQKALNLVMPIVIFTGFNFIAYKKFSWSSR